MQNCKSVVAIDFECYFFITGSCIVMYVCRYNLQNVLQEKKYTTFQKEVQFPCQISGPLFT